MKIKAILSVLAFAALFSACKKEADKKIEPVTEKEAAEVISQAMAPESGGLVLQTNATLLMSLTNANVSQCGVKIDTIINEKGGSNGQTYSFKLNWSRVLTCSGNVPSSSKHTFSGSSSYKAPTFSSSDTSTGSFTIAGLAPSKNNLVVSQTYVRNGTQKSSTHAEQSFTSKITIQTSGVNISKATGIILSGSGTVTVTGAALTGEPFSFSGKLTFIGSNKALLALVGGNTYQLSW